jgi:hypothetical protein
VLTIVAASNINARVEVISWVGFMDGFRNPLSKVAKDSILLTKRTLIVKVSGRAL